MNPIVIELPGPPVAWARTRVNIAGRSRKFFTPKDQRDYASALQWEAKRAMKGRPLLTGPLTMKVTARLPIPASWSLKKQAQAEAGEVFPGSKPDWDNFAKLAGDALNCIVYRDDAQICDGRVVKVYATNPSLRIEIAELVEASERKEAA